jgi:hypothetical protein
MRAKLTNARKTTFNVSKREKMCRNPLAVQQPFDLVALLAASPFIPHFSDLHPHTFHRLTVMGTYLVN